MKNISIDKLIQSVLLFLFTIISEISYGQSVIDDLTSEDSSQTSSELFAEKILKISHSKKIFLLSNESQKLGMGDFISLLKNDELVCRALVAKSRSKNAAIKILKIYSLKLWNNFFPNADVQILKGDDSYYINAKRNTPKREETEKDLENSGSILTEEDLFSTTSADDNSLDEKSNRAIKPDNILGVSYGQYSAIDVDQSRQRYAQWGAQWAYQVADNFWGELYYGQTIMKAFPTEDLDTTLTNFTLRAKYTFNAPMYMYLKPYIGFQIVKANSPNAGKQKEDGTIPQEELNKEAELVDELQKNTVIFGVTILKRLVPGWFIKADLGTDILSLGVNIEF